MTTAAMFDTLRFSRRLKSAGCTVQQAEGIAEAIAEEAIDQIATKQDMTLLRQDFVVLKQDVRHGLDKLELTLSIRMGIVAAAVVAANHYWR